MGKNREFVVRQPHFRALQKIPRIIAPSIGTWAPDADFGMRPRAAFGTWIDYFRNVPSEGLGCDASANSWRHGIAWQSLHDVPPESDW
jgi:hypothetical protein